MTQKIKSPQELLELRKRAQETIDLRGGPKAMAITVHMGTCGIAAGARDILAAFAAELERAGVDYVTLRKAGSIGLTSLEPMITLTDKAGNNFRYGKLDAGKVGTIVQEHVVNGTPVMAYLIQE